MSPRKCKIRSHIRRSRMVRRMRAGAGVMGASMLAIGLGVTAVADDVPEKSVTVFEPVRLNFGPESEDESAAADAVKARDAVADADAVTEADIDINADADTDAAADVDIVTDTADLESVEVATGFSAGTRVAFDDEGRSTLQTGGGSAFEDAAFTRRFYVGLGAGLTRVKPRSPVDSLSVGDEESQGFHLLAGYDFSRWISGEIYVADLGGAQIDFLGADVGDVDYQVYGASVIAYLFNSQSGTSIGNRENGLFRKEGLSLYARAGVGGMRNDSDLEYDRDHTAHLALGAGLEYGFSNGVALRAELMAFDTDARYGTLSVVKRFGSVAAPIVPVPVVAKEPPVELKAKPEPPPPPPAVLGETEFAYFPFDQVELQPDALARLDDLIAGLVGNDVPVNVAGHSDSTGPAVYNMGLSERRALAVQSYLVSRGINADRLSIEAYGENRPVADNTTVEGRAANRRVEISRR